MNSEERIEATVGLDLNRRIDQICDRFEAALHAPDIPRLEQYLEVMPPSHYEHLLAELLALELESLRERGQEPLLAEYTRRFPDYRAMVRDVFREVYAEDRTSFEMRPEHVDSDNPWRRVLADFDRFDDVAYLGEGGMGFVYRAFDRQRRETVAVKVIRHRSPSLLYRFKREFRSLVDLDHPQLIRLHELLAVEGHMCITMELIDGRDFLGYVRGGRATPGSTTLREDAGHLTSEQPSESSEPPARGLDIEQLERLREALLQLAHGLDYLHKAGRLHRDIKPSNALVTSQPRVVLLDFGLVARLRPSGDHTTTEPLLMGTAAYMSPEQAAQLPLSPASDWYSVGAMLYQALTGRLPFTGSTISILLSKQQEDPPRPEDLVADAPADLAQLCVEMLQRDPAARTKGDQILERLGQGRSSAARAAEPAVVPSGPTPVVGRQRELVELEKAYQLARQQRTVVVRMRGGSGLGKTTLLEQFLDRVCGRESAIVLAGRCFRQESIPFKCFDLVIDQLTRYLRTLDPQQAEALLPRDVEPLLRMFPVMSCVEPLRSAPRGLSGPANQAELQRRAFASLRELLGRLGDRATLVVAVDDAQWGDLDSASLLRELLRPADAPSMLLLVTYRTEDEEKSPFVSALNTLEEETAGRVSWRLLEVTPLASTETRELALQSLKKYVSDAPSDMETIVRESQGNPLFVLQLADYLGQVEVVGRSPDRQAGLSLEEVLWRRLQSEPLEMRRFVELLAVAGHPVATGDLCAAAGLKGQPQSLLAKAHMNRWIRATPRTDREEIELDHERIRETVLTQLSAEVRRRCHLKLAEALTAAQRTDWELLAGHYHEGGQSDVAQRYYQRAADEARQAMAFRHAASLYQKVLDLVGPASPEVQVLKVCIAELFSNDRSLRESAKWFLSAAAGAPAADAARLRSQAAMHLLIGGQHDEGIALMRDVVHQVGLRYPNSPHRALFALLARRLWLTCRGLKFRRRDEQQIDEALLLRCDVAAAAANGFGNYDAMLSGAFLTQCVTLALRAGEPYRVVRALANYAMISALSGTRSRRRTQKILQRLEEVAGDVDHPQIPGFVRLAHGMASLLEGSFRAAASQCDLAADVFRAHSDGVAWEWNSALYYALAAIALQGDITQLRQRRTELLEEARRRGDLYTIASLSAVALDLLVDDQPEVARQQLEAAVQPFRSAGIDLLNHNAHVWRTFLDLYQGRNEEAWQRAEKHFRAYRRSLMYFVQGVRTETRSTHGSTALALAATCSQNKPLLRAARRDAYRLLREGTAWASAHGQVLWAGIRLLEGNRRLAIASLQAAVQHAVAADMGLVTAAVRLRLGQLLSGDAAREHSTLAETWMAAHDVQRPDLIADVFAPGLRLRS
jgi:serine/threonine protein kinase